MLGAPALDTGLQVGSHKSGVKGQNPLPQPGGHAAFDAAQDMFGLLGCKLVLLAHVQFFVHQYPLAARPLGPQGRGRSQTARRLCARACIQHERVCEEGPGSSPPSSEHIWLMQPLWGIGESRGVVKGLDPSVLWLDVASCPCISLACHHVSRREGRMAVLAEVLLPFLSPGICYTTGDWVKEQRHKKTLQPLTQTGVWDLAFQAVGCSLGDEVRKTSFLQAYLFCSCGIQDSRCLYFISIWLLLSSGEAEKPVIKTQLSVFMWYFKRVSLSPCRLEQVDIQAELWLWVWEGRGFLKTCALHGLACSPWGKQVLFCVAQCLSSRTLFNFRVKGRRQSWSQIWSFCCPAEMLRLFW